MADEPVKQPVVATVVQSGGTVANQSGTVVATAVRNGTGDGTTIRTRAGDEDAIAAITQRAPDVIVQVITPLRSILIRCLRAYFNMLITLVTASSSGLGGDVLANHGFLHNLRDYAVLALGGAAWAFIQNGAELLAKLDQKYPMFRG